MCTLITHMQRVAKGLHATSLTTLSKQNCESWSADTGGVVIRLQYEVGTVAGAMKVTDFVFFHIKGVQSLFCGSQPFI